MRVIIYLIIYIFTVNLAELRAVKITGRAAESNINAVRSNVRMFLHHYEAKIDMLQEALASTKDCPETRAPIQTVN
jgi:hypothetical protein